MREARGWRGGSFDRGVTDTTLHLHPVTEWGTVRELLTTKYTLFFSIRTILQGQQASILSQYVRLFRKLKDEFQKCFLLIVDGSFVIVFLTETHFTYPP